jgi:Abnormal spindle-like microcephaly-assoc'd, ASPM-SPD-2-Hydin
MKVSCTPDCKGKVCGPDGVGGSCGTCPENRYCDGETGQCIASLFVNPDDADTFGGNATQIDNALGLTIDNIVPLFSTIGVNPNDPNDPTEVKAIPDQQTPILLQPDGSYHLFGTGVALNLGSQSEEGHGCVSLISTKDLTNGNAYSSKGIVLPSNCICPDDMPLSKLQCGQDPPGVSDNYAPYVGMLSVFPIKKSLNHLMGFYIADQSAVFADDTKCNKGGEGAGYYGQVGFATSEDGGQTWTKHGPVLSGEPLPRREDASASANGLSQPTFIQAGNYIYAYLDYHPSGAWPPENPNTTKGIQVARARIQSDGLPGEWWKLYHGTFDSGQPGLNGLGDLIPSLDKRMPWISYNTYLGKYLMTFVAEDGWYYSTLDPKHLDQQDWSEPEPFLGIPGISNWKKGHPTWENMVFVTPGLASNHITGQEGLVFFAAMPCWSGCSNGQPGGRAALVGRYRINSNPQCLPVVDMSIAPTSLNFGSVNVGQSSKQTITITNQASSTAASTGNVGTLSAPFSVVSGGGAFNLSPKHSVTVTVQFSPTVAGPASASLSVTHNATNKTSPTTVELSGIGVVPSINISITPSAVNFGSVNVGQSSKQTITIANHASSTAALTGNVGTLSAPFSVVSGGGAFNLSPGQSVTVTVQFSPTVAGPASASFPITHNATHQTSPTNLSLGGTGVNIPVISVTPTSNDYGKVKVKGTKSASFVVKNIGAADLSISGSKLTGTDASMFSITSGSGSETISPGKSLTIKVAFKPTSAGSKSAMLEITSSDPVTPILDDPLRGTGQ